MATYEQISVGTSIDLEGRTVGLLRDEGRAVLMSPTAGPPNRIEGYTVGMPHLDGDAPHDGEVHPDGDELLCMVSGRIEVHLELPEGDRTLEVGAGESLVVPRGVWHKVHLLEPGQLLHITPGPRGEHRPLRRSPA